MQTYAKSHKNYGKIRELTQNPVRITQNPVRIMQNMRTYAKSRENYGKISKLTQNPVRITQNMRTYAKSRENYAKYTNLRKIPWELPFYPTKIFFLPIRILQNIQNQNYSYRKFRRAQKFRTFHTGKNIRLAVSLTGSCDFTPEISGFRQLMSSPAKLAEIAWNMTFEHFSNIFTPKKDINQGST